jgi:hypothetical protein
VVVVWFLVFEVEEEELVVVDDELVLCAVVVCVVVDDEKELEDVVVVDDEKELEDVVVVDDEKELEDVVVVNDEEELEDMVVDRVESIEVELVVFDVDRDFEAVEKVVVPPAEVLVEVVALFVTESPFIFAAVIPTAMRRTSTANANNVSEADLFILKARKYSHFDAHRTFEQILCYLEV